MRYFKLSASLFVALLVVVQVVYAQSPINMQLEKSVYNLDEYRKDFKTGFSGILGQTEIHGQVFRPVPGSMMFEGYPGVELTLDAGADFSQQVLTDAKGYFIFEDVPVGAFTIFAQNTETNAFGSVSVMLTKDLNNASNMSAYSTNFDVAGLKLLFTDKELYILGQDSGKELVQPLGEVEVASEMAVAGGVAAGFGGGDMGMFGAALGVAGLATGIAAMASGGGHGGGHGDFHGFTPRPVSTGAENRPPNPGGRRDRD